MTEKAGDLLDSVKYRQGQGKKDALSLFLRLR